MELIMHGFSHLLALLVLFSAFCNLNPKQERLEPINAPLHVIFDLNGVLLTTSKATATGQLTTSDSKFVFKRILDRIALFGVLVAKKTGIKHKLYDILNHIQPSGNDHGMDDPWGNQLPGLMADWQRGIKTNEEIRQLILPVIKKNKQWFSSRIEQRLVYNLARMMFTPEKMMENVISVKDGIQFAYECKKKGYGVYVLSNWDAESIELVQKKFPKLFDLFDGIIISGQEQLVKPQPEIYQIFTKTFGANNCVFIDDQLSNVHAAREQGMYALHCKPKKPGNPGDWKRTKKQFAALEKHLFGEMNSETVTV